MMAKYWMDRLDLPEEHLPGLPLVEIAGHKRVLIEHHCGVTEYGRECVCVKVKFGRVWVQGSGLELSCMTRHTLIISGCIEGIRLERRG